MKYFFSSIFLCFSFNITAQQVEINTHIRDSLRNQSIIHPATNNSSQSLSSIRPPQIKSAGLRFELLPLQLIQQYNSTTPYGWNDGPMITAKGYQAMFSTGMKLQYKRWDLQIQPEWVYAANNEAEDFPFSETDQVRMARLLYLNNTDIPLPFGNHNYTRLNPGQSHLYYHFDKMAIGISTENLWWGPGTRNALLMSNNAPGFLHATLHTSKPIHTKIGAFEGQLIAGKLQGSGYNADPAQYQIGGQNYFIAKPDDWRYLSGLSINYQPKWIPGLYIGLNRVFQLYSQDLGNGISDFLPVITPFQKKNLNNEDEKKRDQLASVFLRWVLPESKAELYVEYGKNDHSSSFFDLLISPDHARAFLTGFRKIFSSAKKDQYIAFKAEITHMQQTADRLIRPAGAWYLHGSVLHGYTHRGQVLGAGIGPGSNLQTMEISFWKKHQVLGFQIERYAHNLDFFYDAYTNAFKDYNRKWVDLILTTQYQRTYNNLQWRTNLSTIWMRHYQWQPDDSKINFQLQTSLSYKF